MKKHYLFLMRSSEIGGAERRLISFFEHVNYNKYDITWVINRDTFSQYFKEKGLPVKIETLPQIKDGFCTFQNFFKFYNFFRRTKPDVIVFSQFYLASFSIFELIAGLFATKGNVYMISHDCPPPFERYESKKHFGIIPSLGLEWRIKRLEQKLLIYFTKYTLAVSKASLDALIKIHNYPERKLLLSYHGVDIQRFTPSFKNRLYIRKWLNTPSDAIVIVSSAGLDKIKCLDRLIKAFGVIANERTDIWLFFAGDGNERDHLTNMVNSLNESENKRVKFLGFIDDIVPILQASDIFVSSSDSEGFCNACMEAIACGLVSVVTDCGGPTEFIRDGYNGFVVPKSTEGVLNGLRKALTLSDEEREKFSNNSIKVIRGKFILKDNVRYALNLLGMN